MRFLVFAVLAMLAAPVGEAKAQDVRAGEWIGKYVCQQGTTGLRLVLNLDGNPAKALFHFYALPENPTVPEGCFIMSGVYKPASGDVTLIGVNWIHKPDPRFSMVNVQARMDAQGKKMNGKIFGVSGCNQVTMTRAKAPRPLPAVCAPR